MPIPTPTYMVRGSEAHQAQLCSWARLQAQQQQQQQQHAMGDGTLVSDTSGDWDGKRCRRSQAGGG